MVTRIIFWILGTALFYVVALVPNLEFAAFSTYTRAHLMFLGGCAIVFFLFWLFDKFVATGPRPSPPQRGS